MSLTLVLAGWLGAVTARAAHRIRRRTRTDITEAEYFIADLGSEFDGYTIVALSDFHHPPGADRTWLREAVDATNAAAPDLIALLGDYGSSFRRAPHVSRAWYRVALAAMEPDFGRLRATDGIVAVLGNHDYYAGSAGVREWLQRQGVDVLVNRARHLRRGESVLRVAGMDDFAEGTADPHVGCEPGSGIPTIMLSHNPDGVIRLSRDIRVDMMLAGHTHGGQVVIPGYGAPLTMARTCGRRSASGWIANPRAALYVTRGLGAQLPFPVRVNCRPEILILRLRNGQQPA